jgi:hypothetical protein
MPAAPRLCRLPHSGAALTVFKMFRSTSVWLAELAHQAVTASSSGSWLVWQLMCTICKSAALDLLMHAVLCRAEFHQAITYQLTS